MSNVETILIHTAIEKPYSKLLTICIHSRTFLYVYIMCTTEREKSKKIDRVRSNAAHAHNDKKFRVEKNVLDTS